MNNPDSILANKKKKKYLKQSDPQTKEEEWVESNIACSSKEQPLTRDSWMTMDYLDSLPTTTKSRKDSRRPDPQDKLGTHERELNPYWKNGGQGLPAEEETPNCGSKSKYDVKSIGDGGLRWWEKALERCKQTAVDEHKSLEEVAAERYGSLDFLYRKISECGGSNRKSLLKFSNNIKFQRPSELVNPNSSQKKDFVKKTDIKKYDRGWNKKTEDIQKFNKNKMQGNKDALEMASSASESDKEEVVPTYLSPPVATVTSEPLKETEESNTSILNEEQMNQLGAQIVKAELLGDLDKAKQLKLKLEEARKAKSNCGMQANRAANNRPGQSKVELLMTKDRYGNVRPVSGKAGNDTKDRKADRKRRANETHSKGERQKYFADDDEYSLNDLVQREKTNDKEDSFKKYARLANKMFGTEDDFDDRLIDSVAGQKSNLMDSRQKQLAIIEQKRMASKLDNCLYCFDNIEKSLIVAIGKQSILCLPRYRSMVDGCCLVVPMQHVTQITQCDEDVAMEIDAFIRSISKMYESQGKRCIAMETCINLKKAEHCVIECVPVPMDLASSCPMYFKKAIMEIGSEWAQNKKLVEVKGRNIRSAVPFGFPYFWVSFGLTNGYAHVIEDVKAFDNYFGREIIGGMLDLDPFLWRKPHVDSFDTKRIKTLEFSKNYKNFDWTLSGK